MIDQINKLLAAASGAGSAATDMVECARDGRVSAMSNVGSGETLVSLVDAVRLFLDAVSGETEDEAQLYGAVVRFLDAKT